MRSIRALVLLVLFVAATPLAAINVSESDFSRTPRTDDAQALIAPRFAPAEAPKIDGDLADACWSKAAAIKSFWLAGTTGTAEDQTLAWIGFDKDNLYVAYACQDKKLTGAVAGAFPRDAKQIWSNDGVEVHLSPARNAGKVFQFILGAGGGQYDQNGSLDKNDRVAWNADWQGAVKQQPYGYSAEICIPLASVIDRKQFDVDRGTWWKIKLTRVDFGPSIDGKLSSWTRMGSNTMDQYSLGDLYFEDRNILTNGSAEVVDSTGKPVGWEAPANHVQVIFSASTEAPAEGKQSARVEIRGETKPGMNSRIFAGAVSPHRQPVETTYRFSADARVEAQPGALVAYFVTFNGNDIAQINLAQNKPWQHVDAKVTVEAGKTATLPCIQAVPTKNETVKQPGGMVYLDNVRFEAVEMAELAGDADAVCLTGNAFGAYRTRNGRIEGTYSYFEPGTIGHQFPDYLQNQKPPEVKTYDGSIPFAKGLLTDGQTATSVQWGNFWTGSSGHDIVFDLGAPFVISRVVVLGDVGLGQLWLKSDGEARYTLAASSQSLFQFDTAAPVEVEPGSCTFSKFQQPARHVRVQLLGKRAIPAEIQIWGKPVSAASGETEKRKPYLQNEGKTPIEKPQSRPMAYKNIPPIFPVPHEWKLEGPALTLRDGMTIVYAPGADKDRALTTAQVLADELQTCFGVKLSIAEGTSGDIVLAESKDAPNKADGYTLVNDGKRVTIRGHDQRGTFYGTQSLLSLVRLGDSGAWEMPGATVRDWPDMAVRYIQGRPVPDKNLVRALARFRVTHYEPQYRSLQQAADMDAQAARYFVQFVVPLDFNSFILSKDPNLTERPADEDIKTVPTGRRNANPAHPKSWEIYEAEVAKWLPKFHGNLASINYDETYQTQGGSRWNVSPESRALKLSAGALIAWQMNRIDKLFKKYGKSIVMHDTAFMSKHNLSYPGDPDPNWLTAIPQLPKDTRFLVWHPKEIGTLLTDAGFEQYSYELDESDWRKKDLPQSYNGMVAYMNESSFTPAKLINIIGVTWNLAAPRPNDPQANMVTASYIPVWRELHEGVRPPSRYATAKDFTPIDISAAANRSRIDTVAFDGKGFVDLGPNCDLRALPAGRQEFAGIPFDIIDEKAAKGSSIVMIHNAGDVDKVLPSDVSIDIADLKASGLLFLHTLENRPGHNYLRRKELAGFYIMEYEDGTYGKCEIKYAVNTANWTGRPVNSGYNPKGHSMTDGFLAWEGDTTSGLPAFLYATEWTNPRPDKTIVRIHLRSARSMGNMNPMLYAVTAVSPRLAAKELPGAAKPEMPSMQRLAAAQPTGTFYDLAGGKDESDLRYIAPDGTIISCASMNTVPSDYVRWDVIEHRSCVGMVNEDGNYSTARTSQVEYAFPAPTALAGALVTGGFRRERKTENFGEALLDYQIETSADGGKNWQVQSEAKNQCPEEQGPAWIATSAPPVTNLRVTAKPVNNMSDGIQSIKIYKR